MNATPLVIDVKEHDQWVELTMKGPVDSLTSETFDRRLEPLGQQVDVQVLVDGRGLTYINSRGIGGLMALHKRALIHGGCLAIYGLNSRITKTLELLGLGHRLHLFTDRDTALDFLRKERGTPSAE